MPDDQDDGQNDNLKELRKLADKAKQHEAELDAARREMAFVKAGIDTDTKLGKMLLRTYEGELDRESIRAEAKDVGFTFNDERAPAKEEQPIPDDERRQTQERQALGAESEVSKSDGPRPQELAAQAFDEARGQGLRMETAAQAALEEYLKAAQAGDKRVLYTP